MHDTEVHLRGGYVSNYAADPKMMLVELNSSQQQRSDNSTEKELYYDYDLSQMLANVKKVSSSSKGTAALRENDPKVMLADKMDAEDQLSALAKRLGVTEEVEAMLADLDEEKEAASTDESEDEDDDLETLRGKMAAIFSLASDIASKGSQQTIKNMSIVDNTSTSQQDGAGILELDGIPYPEIDELEAKKEREEMVKRENEKLDATIKYVLEEEERYRAIEEKKYLPSRLIVTNLAADIDEEAIRIFFVKYKWEIRNITILPGREPVKRTRTAYIDMYNREMAVRASYEFGGIYGLIAKIKLAVE